MTSEELTIVYEAAKELESTIINATEEDIEELDDFVDDGFPISIDVILSDDCIEQINTAIGHVDGYEWHGMGDTLENVLAEKHKLLVRLSDHIETAIENHRDVAAQRLEY